MENQEVYTLIKNILTEKQITTENVIISKAPQEIEVGYMSQIIKVSCEDLQLFIKVAPTKPEFERIVELCFKSEIYFYSKIIPQFNALQQKYTGTNITFVPKFYKATKKSLVLEDLTPKGFTMLDRKSTFNKEHANLVLEELGKFHALSFALQNEDKTLWDSLDIEVDGLEIFSGEVLNWYKDALKKAYELYKSIDVTISGKIKDIHDNLSNELKKLLAPSQKYPSVIANLDTWCNNLLFKHAFDEVTPIKVILVDFQEATKASPVLDVSCFLYLNGNEDSITNWKEMLGIYYRSLYTHAKLLHCSLDDCYSWDMFLDDWKDYSKYGMIKALLGINLNTRDEENVEDFFHVPKWNKQATSRAKHLISHLETEGFL